MQNIQEGSWHGALKVHSILQRVPHPFNKSEKAQNSNERLRQPGQNPHSNTFLLKMKNLRLNKKLPLS
jgi:hypothetical protein